MVRALIAWFSGLFRSAPPAALGATGPVQEPEAAFPVAIAAHLFIEPAGRYPAQGFSPRDSVFTTGMIHGLFYQGEGPGGVFDGVEAKGQPIPVPQNEELTSLLMDTYGGNLPLTFDLPDLRGNAMWGPAAGARWRHAVPVTWLIATTSQPAPQYPPAAAAPLAGMIMPYAGQGAIDGWLVCDGGSYDPAAWPDLFAAIGGTFDPGGSNALPAGVHALPDLTGRLAMGAGGPMANGWSAPALIGLTSAPPSADAPVTALCVNFLICVQGAWPYVPGHSQIPSNSGFLGQVVAYAGTVAPPYWAICDGSLLQIEQNMELFDLMGNAFGGDGEQTFGLPDMRGRMIVGSA